MKTLSKNSMKMELEVRIEMASSRMELYSLKCEYSLMSYYEGQFNAYQHCYLSLYGYNYVIPTPDQSPS